MSCKNSEKNIEKGKLLFTTVGCANCHSTTGVKLYGPSLHSILNSEITVIRKEGEFSIKIDKAYLQRSIKDPNYEKPIDFKNSTMPITTLTDHEIDCIVSYLMAINRN